MLKPKLKKFGDVAIQTPYRPVAEFKFRAAHVALFRARWDAIHPDGDLFGAPELVISAL